MDLPKTKPVSSRPAGSATGSEGTHALPPPARPREPLATIARLLGRQSAREIVGKLHENEGENRET